MSKSGTSTLVGIAHDEGYIKSIDEPITRYIPKEKAKGYEKITIKHLLTMPSWAMIVSILFLPDRQ